MAIVGAYSKASPPCAVLERFQVQVCHVLPFANSWQLNITFNSVLKELQVSLCDIPAGMR